MFTASEVFDLAIQVEENGERFYREFFGKVRSKSLREMLEWLANEEFKHREVFLRLKQDLCAGSDECGPISGLSGEALRAAMGRHAFSLDELELGEIADERELLRIAIEFETDAIHFYEFIASFNPDARAIASINEIRRHEMDHKNLLIGRLAEL